MKTGDMLYFSPKFKFADLPLDDREKLIDAFADRLLGFYLEPTKKLNEKKHGFLCGIICVTTIDFIARIVTGKTGKTETRERFKEWLEANIQEFRKPNPKEPTETLAARFYRDFRCGLVHEGRITNLGQFSYEQQELVSLEQDVMLVNPELLLVEIERALGSYLALLRTNTDAFEKFEKNLRNDFEEEVIRARSLS